MKVQAALYAAALVKGASPVGDATTCIGVNPSSNAGVIDPSHSVSDAPVSPRTPTGRQGPTPVTLRPAAREPWPQLFPEWRTSDLGIDGPRGVQ